MQATPRRLAKQAGRWARFARAHHARFDVELKAAESTLFCAETDARAFTLPSSLVGTARLQHNVGLLQQSGQTRLKPLLRTDGRIALRFGQDDTGQPRFVGYLKPKHAPWVRPLLRYGLVFSVIAVTGGTADKPTRGVNIAIGHIAEALDAAREAARPPSRRRKASPSASPQAESPAKPPMERPTPRTWNSAQAEVRALFG